VENGEMGKKKERERPNKREVERAKWKKKIARVWENEKETERRKCGSTNGQIIYYSITHRRTPQWPMVEPMVLAPGAPAVPLLLV